VPFVDLLQEQVIENETCPTNLLRVAIKTLTNVFDQVDPEMHLKETDEFYKFDPKSILGALMCCEFDDHSNQIDQ